MRVRYVALLLCAVAILACTNSSPSNGTSLPSSTTSLELALENVVISPTQVKPPVTGSLPAPVVPVGTYMVAWQRGMQGVSGFDPSVGVASLDEGDRLSDFCADGQLQFDINASVVVYCRTTHEGPDALPQIGMILVPYRAYTKVVQDSRFDRTAVDQGTAVLMAAGYAQHVLTELQSSDVPQADTLRRHANCVTGLTLHSYIYALDEAQWDRVGEFLENFTVASAPAWDLSEIKAGYASGRLQTCLS